MQLVLLITVKFKYETSALMLPSMLSLAIFISAVLGMIFTITTLVNMNFINFLLYVIIAPTIFVDQFIPIILISMGFIVMAILLQSYTLLAININYKKIGIIIKNSFKALFRIKTKVNAENTDLIVVNRPLKLTFLNSFTASLFSFALVFFFTLLLFAIGYILGSQIIV
ncbi:MAG: hypothetical protein RSB76_00285 [Clostridia bacterium]